MRSLAALSANSKMTFITPTNLQGGEVFKKITATRLLKTFLSLLTEGTGSLPTPKSTTGP
jgi:hypothetical protein